MADIFTPEERLEIDAAKRKFSVPDTPPVDKYAGTGPLDFVTDVTNPVYEGAVNTATELSRIIETLWKNATTSDYQRWKYPPEDAASPLDRAVPYPPTGDTVSDIGRDLAQLGFSILPVAKATRFLRPTSLLGQAGKSSAIFGIAEGLGFSGNTANLADVLKESFPEVESIASEYLASEPGDSMAERKFKNALAAVGVIAPFESMIGIFRLWRKSRINPFVAASNKARDITPNPSANQKLLEGPTNRAIETVEEIAEQVGMKVPKGVSETKTKPKNTGISRRNFFKVAAGGLAAAAIPGGALKVATEAVAPAVSEAAKFSLGKWIALKKTVNIAMSHVGDPTWSGTANESSDAAFDALEEFESTYSKELAQVVEHGIPTPRTTKGWGDMGEILEETKNRIVTMPERWSASDAKSPIELKVDFPENVARRKDKMEYWKGLEAELEGGVDYTVNDLQKAIAEREEDLMFKYGSDSSKQDLMLYLQERDNTQLDLSLIPSPAPTPPKLENPVPSIQIQRDDSTDDVERIIDAENLPKIGEDIPDGSAAIRVGGRTFTSQIHADALSDAEMSGVDMSGEIEEGYVTSKGRFVDRREAAMIDPMTDEMGDLNPDYWQKDPITGYMRARTNRTAIATTKLTPSETKFLTDLRDNDPVNWKELITDFAPSLQFDGATMTFNESESAGIQQFFEDMVISNQASERLPPSFYKLDFPPFKRTTFSEDESGNVSIKSAGLLAAGGVGAAAGGAIADRHSSKLRPGDKLGTTQDGRPIIVNEDGSVSATKLSAVPDPRTPGLWMNVPTLSNGRQISEDAARQIIIDNNFIDPETGKIVETFPTVDDAIRRSIAIAKQRNSDPNVISAMETLKLRGFELVSILGAPGKEPEFLGTPSKIPPVPLSSTQQFSKDFPPVPGEKPQIDILLNNISIAEGADVAQLNGTSAYDMVFDHGNTEKPSKPLSTMTMQEVYDFQTDLLNNPNNTKKSSAAGKYQAIRLWLFEAGKKNSGDAVNPSKNSWADILGLTKDTIFDAGVQERLGRLILREAGYNKFLSDGNTTAFQKRLSKKWASIPDPDTGKSAYSGQPTKPFSTEILDDIFRTQ